MPVHSYLRPLDEVLLRRSYTSRSKKSSLSIDEQVPFTHTISTDSPAFNRLPLELQAEIFVHCISPFSRPSIQDYPWKFLQVCKGWRTLALSTSRLWSSFGIEVRGKPDDTYMYDKKSIVALKLWLDRSRSYPLAFRIVHTPYGRIPDTRSIKLLEMLAPHAPRWKHVEIIVPSICLAAVQSSLPHELPALQSLTLQTNGQWEPETPIDLNSLDIPWSQLTAIDLQLDYNHLLPLDDLLYILSEADNLKSCTMGADCILSAEARSIDRICLSKLEAFSLYFQGGPQSGNGETPAQHMLDFLSLLYLPSIRNLQIEWLVQWNGDTDDWSPNDQSKFASFLRDTAYTLETLGLIYLPLGGADVLNCIEQVPGLRRFDLRCSLADDQHDPVTNDFIHALTVKTSTQDMPSFEVSLPLLQELSLMCHGASYHPDILLAMIKSRIGSRVSLKKIYLGTMTSMSDELLETLRNFNEDGLEVNIDVVNIR